MSRGRGVHSFEASILTLRTYSSQYGLDRTVRQGRHHVLRSVWLSNKQFEDCFQSSKPHIKDDVSHSANFRSPSSSRETVSFRPYTKTRDSIFMTKRQYECRSFETLDVVTALVILAQQRQRRYPYIFIISPSQFPHNLLTDPLDMQCDCISRLIAERLIE